MKNLVRYKILYQIPSLETIYAYRTIYEGYKNAFRDLGHEFRPLTSADRLEETLRGFQPDVLFTATHGYYQKFLDLRALREYRENRKLLVLTKVDFWNSPISRFRINEAKSLKDDIEKVRQMKAGELGDVFFHVCMPNDPRMSGFKEAVGKDYISIPLAADQTMVFPDPNENYRAHFSYVGTNLPQKRKYFRKQLFPLKKKYDVRILGQDWTLWDRFLGILQRFGQYYGVSWLSKIQTPKLLLEEERNVYSSCMVNLNLHEDYQRQYGGDVNERFFKIPACRGFQISDYVECMEHFFSRGEFVAARDEKEWFEMIEHYLQNPEERNAVAEKAYRRVLSEHTYHHRVKKITSLLEEFRSQDRLHESSGVVHG